MLYVPEGFAHGFQTLEDDTEVFYQMSEFYAPECARGVRWNDPAFGIEWPIRGSHHHRPGRQLPGFRAPGGPIVVSGGGGGAAAPWARRR